jgi:hypothetical protein
VIEETSDVRQDPVIEWDGGLDPSFFLRSGIGSKGVGDVDSNKAKKVIEVGFTVAKCCGTCQNFELDARWDGWGVCREFTYLHGKDKERRHLPVQRVLFCDVSHWTALGLSAPTIDRIEAERYIQEAEWVGTEDNPIDDVKL